MPFVASKENFPSHMPEKEKKKENFSCFIIFFGGYMLNSESYVIGGGGYPIKDRIIWLF